MSVTGKVQNKVKGSSSSGGSVSQIPKIYSNTTKNISDIFISVTARDGHTINPCIILIEGAPGIGKTVLAKETAFQWAEKKLLRSKKILLLLFLRECSFKNIKKPINLVQHVVKRDKIAASLTEHLLKTEGEDLAIVIDGYDEISAEYRKSSVIVDIIYRRIFAKCCLVITSRPTASAGLHSIVNCRVEIVGFTEEDRLDYIQTALKGDNSKVEALTHYLQSNPTINALCYIPLNMTILLCLVEDGIDKLPKTQTDMYRKFIEMTILHFIEKIDSEASRVVTSITELPHPYNEIFEELTKLAYKALDIDKIVFTLDDIKTVCPNIAKISSNWDGLGLLKAVKYSNAESCNVTFHFLHFSIQEYMAAWYISTLSNNEQIKLLQNTFWELHYYNTWIMYVGITHGNSFALKHFLSGNWFQLTTKIFKPSSISNKFLKNKIRCLHLFQCFVESNNEDMITPVSHFLQGNQIDLSNQTLLPSDVDTLGFFLIRSVNKIWKILNLSGCNIGSTGIYILCDRFLHQKNHNITIKAVDFSFNQLNFSTLVRLFELYKTWYTSEILLTDSEEILQNKIVKLYRAIEDAFVLYGNNIRANLQFGSFLLAYGNNVVPLLLKAVFLKSIHLINCNWELPETISEKSFHKSIRHYRYNNCFHLTDTSFAGYIMEMFKLQIIDKNVTSIFIYNPALSNQDADKIYNVIGSTMAYGVRLVISSNKVQGIINTSSLNTELFRLEILNLIASVRALFSNTIQAFLWRQDLCCNGNENDLIIDIFIGILHKINNHNHCRDLQIVLREKHTLIASNVNYSCIFEKFRLTYHHYPIRAVYFNNCIISEVEYKILFNSAHVGLLTNLYVHFCYLGIGCLTMLFNKLLCKQIFIHTLSYINIDSLALLVPKQEDCSTLLVAKNMIFAYKPTSKQIAIAQQLLDPSINALKLMNYRGTFDTFNQIMMLVVSTSINWTELDLSNCSIGEIEYDIFCKYLKSMKHFSNVNVLKVSSKKLTMSVLSKVREICLIWRVQELVLCDIIYFIKSFSTDEKLTMSVLSKLTEICLVWKVQEVPLCDIRHFIKNFSTNTTSEKISLSLICNSGKIHFICNFHWDKIVDIPNVSNLYFINCHHSSSIQINSIISYVKLPVNHISQIYIINSTLYENDILNFLEILVNRRMELSICHTNMSINNEALYSYITKKETLYQGKISFVTVMKNFMCGYNATKDQLHLLQSPSHSELQYAVVVMSHTIQKQLFLFQNEKVTTLHFAGINNYSVGAANDLVAVVSQCSIISQNLDLADNILQALVMMIIAKGLKESSTLRSLNMSNSHITKEAAGDFATSLSHNTHVQLKEFDISNNHLQTEEAITLAKGLHDITSLTRFCISNNNITEEAASDIAFALSHNHQLQELDISNNHLKAKGAVMLVKRLHKITTLINFRISYNNITEEAAGAIAAFISHNTQLQEIDISNNHLQASGAIILATKGLHNITKLTKIFISNNNITELAAGEIAIALSHNTRLQELDLTKFLIIYNSITEKNAGGVAFVLSCCAQLQELDISDNKSGAVTLAKGLHRITTTLAKVCISNNNITKEAAHDIAVFFSHNTNLQELDISNNHLQAAGAITLAKGLQNIGMLRKFYISNNNITEEAAGDIARLLYNNTQLEEFDIGFNELGSSGIMIIAPALQRIKSLQILIIHNNKITDKAKGSIKALISCKLKKFYF